MDQLQMTLLANDRIADAHRASARFHGPTPEPRPLPPRRRPLAATSAFAAVAAAWSTFSRWVWAVEPMEPLAPMKPLGIEA